MTNPFDFANARQDHLDVIAEVIREEKQQAEEGRFRVPSSDEIADAVLHIRTEASGRCILMPIELVLRAMERLDR